VSGENIRGNGSDGADYVRPYKELQDDERSASGLCNESNPFNLYTAELEERLKKRRIEGIRVGRFRF